jgi:hypothetical protein
MDSKNISKCYVIDGKLQSEESKNVEKISKNSVN